MSTSDYGYTDYYGYITEETIFSSLILIFLLIILAVTIITIVSQWKLFTKAGKPGWYVLIPYFNTYEFFEIVGMKGWYVFLSFIPLVGTAIFLVFNVMFCFKLATAYGKENTFGIGILILPVVFYPILAFSKTTTYVGNNANTTNQYNPNMNNTYSNQNTDYHFNNSNMNNPYNNQSINNPYTNQNIGPMNQINQQQPNSNNNSNTMM